MTEHFRPELFDDSVLNGAKISEPITYDQLIIYHFNKSRVYTSILAASGDSFTKGRKS